MFEISWVHFRNRRKKAGNPVELLQENSSILSVHVPLILITSLVKICLRCCHGYLGIPFVLGFPSYFTLVFSVSLGTLPGYLDQW